MPRVVCIQTNIFADCIESIFTYLLARVIRRNKHIICLRNVCSVAAYRNWVHIYITPTGRQREMHSLWVSTLTQSVLSTALGLDVIGRALCLSELFSRSLSLSCCLSLWVRSATILSPSVLLVLCLLSQHPEQHFGVARCPLPVARLSAYQMPK